MVKQKGAAYLIDAAVGIMILLIFTLGTFSIDSGTSWNSFENQVAAQDLSYTLKKTGHLEKFVSRGETGSLQTAIATVSEKDFTVSGELSGIPYNMKVGFYTSSPRIHSKQVTPVRSTDECADEVDNQLRTQSEAEILSTDNGQLAGNDYGVKLYLGSDPYHGSGDPFDYDSLWINNGTSSNCDFYRVERPFLQGETFLWGDRKDSNRPEEFYEFDEFHLDQESLNHGDLSGRIELHEASQIRRFERTFNKRVRGVDTSVETDSFNFSDELEDKDVLVFRGQEGLEKADENSGALQEYTEDGSILFLTTNNNGELEQHLKNDGLLSQLGFEWVETSASSGDSSIGFHDFSYSKRVEENFHGLDASSNQIDIAPGGKVSSSNTGAVSNSKLVYNPTREYTDLSEDVSENMDSTPSEDGAPDSDCGTMTREEFEFTTESGSETYTVLNTEVGENCNQHVVNIDFDDNGEDDFGDDGEGPFLLDEQLEIASKPYTISSISDDSVTFEFVNSNGNANIEAVNYATFSGKKGKAARANYENYDTHDRKLLAATIYWLAEPYNLGEEPGSVNTNIRDSVDRTFYSPYSLKLGWNE